MYIEGQRRKTFFQVQHINALLIEESGCYLILPVSSLPVPRG